MTKFRFHRGGLAESMATVIEVANAEELAKAVSEEHQCLIVATDLLQENEGFDDRIQWDTHLITFIAPGGVVGFSDGPIPGVASA
jgi:hypothetical protein